MVFLKVKQNENEAILYETKCDTSNEVVIKEIVQALCAEMEDLIKYGPMKSPEKQGLDTTVCSMEDVDDYVPKKLQDTMDPTGRREGKLPETSIIDTITKTIAKVKVVLDKDNAEKKIVTSLAKVAECMNELKGCIMMAYPMGLPEHDSIAVILRGEFVTKDMMEPGNSSLWFAGKELYRDKKLQDTSSIGKNERTTIIVKLTKKGSGPPARENVVSAEQQKNMMAYWYKKQEEHKKLLDDEDDSFVNSEWANPKGLKAHFQGVSNVRLPK